jgi:hypothetical protein
MNLQNTFKFKNSGERGAGENASEFQEITVNYLISGSGYGRSTKPVWSRAGSSILYTDAEVRTLTPVRENVEKRSSIPDLRDVFLCHAWDDRKGAAKELNDLLEFNGVSVWFNEKDVLHGIYFNFSSFSDVLFLKNHQN